MTIDEVKKLSADQIRAILVEKEKEENAEKQKRREAYEIERHNLVEKLCSDAEKFNQVLAGFKEVSFEKLLEFYEKMKQYGDVAESNKGNFSIKTADGSQKIEFSRQIRKGFDERANMAEVKLKEFLEKFVKVRDKKIYRMVVSLLERNAVSGDFDITLINRLYAMENDFDDVLWKEAIQLFKESYTEQKTTMYVRFFKADAKGFMQPINLNFASINF